MIKFIKFQEACTGRSVVRKRVIDKFYGGSTKTARFKQEYSKETAYKTGNSRKMKKEEQNNILPILKYFGYDIFV